MNASQRVHAAIDAYARALKSSNLIRDLVFSASNDGDTTTTSKSPPPPGTTAAPDSEGDGGVLKGSRFGVTNQRLPVSAFTDKEKASFLKRCARMRELALSSGLVTFMREAMDKKGCATPADTFFECRLCGEQAIAGGFAAFEDPPKVVLCADHLHSDQHAIATVGHEMVHAFDHCATHVDWTDAHQRACSEVRANNLSTECWWLNELFRANVNVGGQHRACVRRRAADSIEMAFDGCSREKAEGIVDTVFEPCFADTAPMTGIP